MTGSARRRLAAIDDPLDSSAEPRSIRQERPPSEQLPALFVRLPTAHADALARAAFELRAHKRELVAALIARYVDPSTETGLRELSALLEEYRLAR